MTDRRPSSVNIFTVNALEATVLVRSSPNLVRLLILMKSRTSLKMGHVGSKTRSLGQIIGKPCVHSGGHSFDPMFMKFGQIVDIDEISDDFLTH